MLPHFPLENPNLEKKTPYTYNIIPLFGMTHELWFCDRKIRGKNKSVLIIRFSPKGPGVTAD